MPVTFDSTAVVGPTITGTTAGAPGNNVLAAQVVKATFDKLIRFKQRTEPYYRKFATVRPADLAYPGSTIDMFRMSAELSLATTPLDEYSDPDYVSLPAPTKKTLTLNEYGNATVTTLRLKDFSWASIDPLQAELLSRNMGDSVDKLVENVLLSSTNKYKTDSSGVVTSGAATNGDGVISSKAVRRIVAEMRGKLALPYDGGLYVGFIHPSVAVALREETDAAGWRPAHIYTENTNGVLFSGDIGVYEGVRWIETTRVPVRTAGTPAKNVYSTIILGKDALVEALNREFSTVITPTTDKFGRLFGAGWYGCAAWGIYNDESVSILETGGVAI